jgi:hypothetical protein
MTCCWRWLRQGFLWAGVKGALNPVRYDLIWTTQKKWPRAFNRWPRDTRSSEFWGAKDAPTLSQTRDRRWLRKLGVTACEVRDAARLMLSLEPCSTARQNLTREYRSQHQTQFFVGEQRRR